MGAKQSMHQKTHPFKKSRLVPQRLSNKSLLKKYSPTTPPMSPPETNSLKSDATSLVSNTNSFNYIDNMHKGETDRNHVKHFALKELFEGNVLKSIEDNLDFTSEKLRVLDVGCGSGTWLMDMATEHPNVQFIGVDQITLHPQAIHPCNITFQVQDVLEGLSFEDNSFDFVQMRLFSMTFDRKFWIQALAEVYRVLKPGGYIQLLEVQYRDKGDEFVQAYAKKVIDVLNANNQDPDVCHNLGPLLEDNRFTSINFVKKVVSLKTHPLRTEILYMIKLTMDSCKPYLFKMYDLKTEKDYLEYQSEYLEHRVQTSESVWAACAGMKPLN